MIFQRLEAQVCRDEGFRAAPYLDTVGVATIGYGSIRINGRPVTLDDTPVSEPTAREMMRSELYESCINAQKMFTRFDRMSHVRQECLVNMAYNLGPTRLRGFKKLIAAAESMNYSEMAVQAKDSKWFDQVGQRAIRICNALETGVW